MRCPNILRKFQKKTSEFVKSGEITANSHKYQVDGEVGRFTFATHMAIKNDEIIFNSKSLFPILTGGNWYKTEGFKEISLIFGTTESSFRKVSQLINRQRRQEGATSSRSLQDFTEVEGNKVIDFVEKKTKKIFTEHDFTEQGEPVKKSASFTKEAVTFSEQEVDKAIEACGLSLGNQAEVRSNPVLYEKSDQTVNISLDDVGVKRQKEKRESKKTDEQEERKRKYAHNTVGHIQKGKDSYAINGRSVTSTIQIIIGFLLNSGFLGFRLQFFVDGQKTLSASILKRFSWYKNIGILLDWYHLVGKCKIQLSLAMKGREVRNIALKEVKFYLWYGMLDKAIDYLNNLDKDSLKNDDAVNTLIGYFERNRSYIPSYAVRNKLGLRNGSSIGEKLNDLLVSHKGRNIMG